MSIDEKQTLSPDNWLEKIGIVRDIGEIKTELVKLNIMLSEATKTMYIHQKTIFGDGIYTGLDKTVDRLNEIEKSRKTHFTAIYVTMAGLVLERLWHIIIGH